MIKTPAPRENMRRDDVVQWLTENGYSAYEIRRMMEQGIIKAHVIRPSAARAWYSATEIKAALDGNRFQENTT